MQNILSATMNTFLILLSGAVFVWTAGMTPGAELFPRIMAGGLALFGIAELTLLFVKIRRDGDKKSKPQSTDASLIRKSFLYMGAFFCLIILFFVALPFIGFAISATIFMYISMVLIGGKKMALRKCLIAILVPALLILVFHYGLDVRLPSFSVF
jgi:Na+/melibiose symporter-like transporter